MTPENYLIYLAALAAFFATPPDTSQLLIVSNSIAHGLRRSAFTILGDLSANAVQMFAAAFGLAAVITTSANAFVWIKWMGVTYLVWIGIRVFRTDAAVTGEGVERPSSVRSRNLFNQGFLTSLSNPFAIVFFGSLFPQFIDPARPLVGQVVILGGTYLVVDGVILVAWGWFGIRATSRIRRFSPKLVNQLCGTIMIVAAVFLATKNVSSG